MSIETFAPVFGRGVALVVGTSSLRAEIQAGNRVLCLSNLSSSSCFVRSGGADVVATTNDYPVLANTQVTIKVDPQHTHVAGVTALGTANLHVIPGEGI